MDLAGLFTVVSWKFRKQILVNEPKHVIALSAISGDVVNKVQQILNRLSLRGRATTQLRQTGFQSAEDVFENVGTARQKKAVKSRKRITDISNIEVTACSTPCRVKVVVRDEIAQAVLHEIDSLGVILDKNLSKLVGFHIIGVHQLLNLLGEELIEDEAKNVVLVFLRLNLGAHGVRRLPDARCELSFIHGEVPFTCQY